jgi:predicted TIM-barrel fold metal-dependent hydrolase
MIALIIDAHTHYGIGLNFPFRAKTIDDMVIVMDKYGVDMACISSAYALLHDCPEGNRRLYEAVKLYPSRFIPFCAVNPRYLDEARDELRKYINENGWKGLKLHPLHQGYPADCRRAQEIIMETARLGVPVLVHSSMDDFTHPGRIANLADKVPDATIIMGHIDRSNAYAVDAGGDCS